MKPFLTLLLAAALLPAPGCVIYRMERYVHEPTAQVQPVYFWAKRSALPKKIRPAEGEVLLVPDFRSFSAINTSPDSFLHVFTRGNRAVFIIDADLEVVATGVKQNVVLNSMTNPRALPNDEGYWGARLRLFADGGNGVKNIDFGKVRGADDLVLTVRWRDGDRIVEQRFPLHRATRIEPGMID